LLGYVIFNENAKNYAVVRSVLAISAVEAHCIRENARRTGNLYNFFSIRKARNYENAQQSKRA